MTTQDDDKGMQEQYQEKTKPMENISPTAQSSKIDQPSRQEDSVHKDPAPTGSHSEISKESKESKSDTNMQSPAPILPDMTPDHTGKITSKLPRSHSPSGNAYPQYELCYNFQNKG
ncbi:MAG: hypothetical protein NTY39_06075 [Campylobacterales bacterium]|nr:hypothetical protein [Campylobacterales bacterium]